MARRYAEAGIKSASDSYDQRLGWRAGAGFRATLLLELLDINGCIVTADAMSCQREIAKKITHGKGDYVLSLKENQPTLYEYAQTYFDDALKNPQWYPEIQSYETLDKGHGRIERRRYYLTSDLAGLANAKE